MSASPDNPVDFLRSRRAAAAGSSRAPEPAPPPADEPEVEISENPLHPSDDRSLDQMDAPDLMSGTGSQMYAGDDGGGGGKPTDGAERIGGGAGGVPVKPSTGGLGKKLGTLVMVAVFVALVVGFAYAMMNAETPAEEPAAEPAAEPPAPSTQAPPPPPPSPPVQAPAASGHPAPPCPGENIGASVRIVTGAQFADEVSWNIDGGADYSGYEVNSESYTDVCLSAGLHTLNYFDAYGDGWGDGAFWELSGEDATVIAGGPQDGAVEGAGGQTEFTLSADGPGTASAESSVTVTIVAGTEYADEISWNIDGGAPFPSSPYTEGNTYAETLALPEGRHVIYFMDSYEDGWAGGYWQIEDAPGGTLLGGGPQNGLVEGAGGEQAFCVVCCDAPCEAGDSRDAGESTSITVGVQTMQFANEISWNLDGGQEFPQEPYADNTATSHGPITLTEGEHTLFYFDSYGDGWNGGYWTITGPNGEVIAGGETDGQVEGAGGEDIFCVSSSARPRPRHVAHICHSRVITPWHHHLMDRCALSHSPESQFSQG